MRNQDIKNFIRDFKSNYRFSDNKNLFNKYFLRGNFVKGFTLLFSNDNHKEDYYFQLDSEDITYLINKYKLIHEDILQQEKENEIKLTKEKILGLNKKLKDLINE